MSPPAADPPPLHCLLCASSRVSEHAEAAGRRFWRCADCALVFVDPGQWLAPQQEADYYRLHRNDPDDPGYRRFVAPLVEALCAQLPPTSQGLDFGCGPGSAPAAMLGEAGHRVRGYDPQFLPDAAALEARYDFIVLCEVIEHLHAPAAVLAQLRALLRGPALIAIKTGFLPEPARFAHWHYLRDPTHVALYSPACLQWLANHLGLHCALRPEQGVALLSAPR